MSCKYSYYDDLKYKCDLTKELCIFIKPDYEACQKLAEQYQIMKQSDKNGK